MQRWTIILLSCLSTAFATPSFAETAIERISRTGILNAGTRTDAAPFSYINGNGEWVGYSIDLLKEIEARLEQALSKEIQLNLVEVTTENRVARVQQGEVDIVCSSTSYTSSRATQVDFSVPYFPTGTQYLVKDDNSFSIGEFRVGIVPRTTNAEVAEEYLGIATFINFEDQAEGLLALEVGRIDALAGDGILLEGLRQTSENPDELSIIPPEPISPQAYACFLNKQNPELLELVNQSLIEFMQGVLTNDNQDVAIFNTWFGAEGVTPVNPEPIYEFFQFTIDSYEDSNQRQL
ncbi:MAG: amino acid ABC transporter substrate-binding protein [Cyanobacteria bacterium CRU_2_1]|nr:amino acid ABC transporter substrate-binding protein [Cyanobacteria bacterium RU_5_0]NJR61538.1 amino acid ABC transporter substrate-binding protein [Cyanobacteria bacterium CRU_2_1]